MKKKFKRGMNILLIMVCLFTSAWSLIFLCRELEVYRTAEEVYDNIRIKNTADNEDGKDYNWNEFPNMAGWVKNKDKSIDYPIMQAEDNLFYLDHMPDGTKNALGSLFLDCSSNRDFTSQISVVYGHHVKNGMMFGALDQYKKEGYYDKNLTMELNSRDKNYTIEIVAAYLADANREGYPSADAGAEEIDAYMKDIKIRSFIKGRNIDYEGKNIIILSTCSYEFDNARLAVVGILGEKE